MTNPKFEAELKQSIEQFAASVPNLDRAIVDEFVSSLCIHDDKVCGFKYSDLKKVLSEQQYHKLLGIVKFKPENMRDFENNRCIPGRGCIADINYACDPNTCH